MADDLPAARPARPSAAAGRELMLRILLPIEYHLRLHRLKLVTGRNMGQAVRAALDVYLDVEERRALPLADADVAERPGAAAQGYGEFIDEAP